MKRVVLMVGVLCAGYCCAESMEARWTDVPLARTEGEVTVTRSADLPSLSVTFRMGDLAPAKITVQKSDGTRQVISLRNQSDRFTAKQKDDDQTVSETMRMPDAMIRFDPFVTRHVRPRLKRYTDEQQQDLVDRWEQLPSASQHVFTLELRQTKDFFEYYLDGSYIGSSVGVFEALVFRLSPAGDVLTAEVGTPLGDDRFLPLDMRWIARPGVFSNAVPSLQTGLQVVADVPIVVASGAASGDVGHVRQMKGSWALECDEHLSRTALEGMPESVHIAVPPTTFIRAWVLCAVDPDPARDPILTARMTRWGRAGRSAAVGIDTITLPRSSADPLPKQVQRVGSIALNGTNQPLYLVEMDVKPGAILDLLAMKEDPHASMMKAPYLDIDFMGKPGVIGAVWDTTRKPDNKSISSVHLFGVTLEKMPVSMRLEQTQPGNIFHNEECPETHVFIRAETPQAQAILQWSVIDAFGRECWKREERLTFAQTGEEQQIVVPLDVETPGWYGLNFVLTDLAGRVWLTHEAAFAQLGTDTRQAGYESPFSTSWFAGAHYTGDDLEVVGPMLLKAGLRKLRFHARKFSEKEFAPWKVTLDQIGWGIRPHSITNKEAAYLELDHKVGDLLERFPHCNAALIFHESYNSRLPPELFGEKSVETPEEAEKARAMAELGNFIGQYYREKFPQIKLLVGNTTHSAAIISALLRYGMKPEYIDWIGMETVGQTSMPEKLWSGGLQGIWLGRETARRLGHDLPVSGCAEFTARTERTLGQQRQAEFYVRDLLISLAYGFERVSPGSIVDAGNSYYNSLWGAGGLCQRNPLFYPKKAYVGMATATRVLDRATFVDKHETGSRTVYAMTFHRADDREVTALWTTVGEADVAVTFAESATVETVDFFGAAQTNRASSQTVTIGTAPRYLISNKPVKSARVQRRLYAPPPPTFVVSEPMTTTNSWVLDSGDPKMESKTFVLPYRQPGTFTLEAVDDDEKGASLEVSLVKEGTLEPLISEYIFLKAIEPIEVKDIPTDIGLWVKGDSGWGKIVFEIEDARKRVWRTEGTWHDWPGDLSVNFDGWRFVRYPIDGSSTELNISPSKRWGGGGGNPVFPIRLRGIYVVVNRQALDPTEMREVPAVLRFKDIGFVYGE